MPREKELLRQKMIERRQRMSRNEVREKSRKIIRNLLKLSAFSPGESIGMYLPVQNEVDTRVLFRYLLHLRAHPILPCCRKNEPGEMDFFPVRDKNDLQKGKFGIQEPCTRDQSAFDCSGVNTFILPGVAFDRQGYRLGFGGGYYDRFLSRAHFSMLVGAAYHFQLLPVLPVEPWDQPVNYVVTEKEIHNASNGNKSPAKSLNWQKNQ